jgi:hypothetical protein
MQISTDGVEWKRVNVLKANFNNRRDITGCYSYSFTAVSIEDIRNAGVFAPNPELTEKKVRSQVKLAIYHKIINLGEPL